MLIINLIITEKTHFYLIPGSFEYFHISPSDLAQEQNKTEPVSGRTFLLMESQSDWLDQLRGNLKEDLIGGLFT